MKSHVGLIVKATRLCNLRCSYCHDWRASGEKMSFEVLAKMIASALAHYDAAQFIWHGGETTLMPMEFYQKAMALQARFLRPGCKVRNNIQTNATRLTDEWISFFKEADFGVGVSLDGPRHLQDRHRLYAGGRSSYDDVLRGIEKLRKHGLPPSILMVVDEDTLELGPDKVFDFFLELNIKSFGCIAAKPRIQPDAAPMTPAEHYVDPPRMTRFFKRLYDRWLEHGDPDIHIRELDGLHDRVSQGGKAHGFCTLAGGCLGHYFIVEPNGDIAHCDLFLGDPAYSFGNVTTTSFPEILRSEKLAQLKTANNQAVDVMRKRCPEFKTCMGGCPHDRYISYRHNPEHSAGCCGQYELISHIRSRLQTQPPRPARLAVPA